MDTRSLGRGILVVEDEVLISAMLEDALADAGYRVIGPFDRVATARAAAETEDFEAAILDVRLDGAFVFPVADALLARDIPFIFTSGTDGSEIPPAYEAAPIVRKPYRLTDVTAALDELLQARRRI
jgi:DNA-binding response OmpR family regulator